MGVPMSRLPRSRRITLPVLLVLVACQGEPVATTTTSATTTTIASITTTGASDPASQSPDDARRDGVIAELAGLPLSLRVEIVESTDTDEGTWVLSRPAPGIEPHTSDCRLGADTGRYPTDFICTTEYGEVLLLDTVDGPIIRAYPLPGVPPEFMVLTEDALYCGRNGEGMLPDSMVCRIDRSSLSATVRIFPGEVDSVVAQPCFYPPSSWSISDSPLAITRLGIDERGLWVDETDGSTRLDPLTLDVLEGASAANPGIVGARECIP
jgi:hypothetical protein